MKNRTSRTLGVLILAAAVLTTGCLDRDLRPLNPCTVSGVVRKIKVTNVDAVDLLFMVDNSNSMGEEQASLSDQFPRLVRTLASGELTLSDGSIEMFPPVKSLRVGVVSSDMGTGGFLVPTCSNSASGDDGILRTAGNVARPGCMATYPSFTTFEPAPGAPPDSALVDAFAADFTCVGAMGTGGCGFEQQLEAVLKALTPSSSSLTFNGGTVGHGDGANAGFLRPTSLLAVIVVSDEDDCSAIDPDLFNPSSTRYAGDLNLRCFQFPEAVHPVERYVDGLLALRDDPSLLVYAAITGVPPELVANPDTIDFDALLADPRMTENIDPTMPTRLEPSCNIPGRGLAFPPRRITTVAQLLERAGAAGIVQSICQDDFTGALNAIIKKIADVLGGACLPRALNPDSTGRVNCTVVETLPSVGDFTTCASLAALGREPTDPPRFAEDGREICAVRQVIPDRTMEPPLVPAGSVGWFYDNYSLDLATRCAATPQRISFTGGAEPKTGTEVRLECLQPVMGGSGTTLDLGSPCNVAATEPTERCDGDSIVNANYEQGLFCEPNTNTCQPSCDSDAVCPGGFVCDFGTDEAPLALPFCQNPTCG